jgi:COPI associated protein
LNEQLGREQYRTDNFLLYCIQPKRDSATVENRNMTEATPLNPANVVTQSMSRMFTPKNMAVLSVVAQEKWTEIQSALQDGDISIRLVALISATALILSSVVGLIRSILSLNIPQSLMEMYSLILGAIMILLESKQLHLPQKYLDKLFHYALFLKYVWGRGILYLLAGSLHLITQGSTSVMDYIVGAMVVLVGIVYIVVGRIAARKLKSLRNSLHSDAQLKNKFTHADTTKKGLTLDQFKLLTDQLGLDVNHREAEIIFLHLDKSADGLLTYSEFQGWWTDLEEDYIF